MLFVTGHFKYEGIYIKYKVMEKDVTWKDYKKAAEIILILGKISK